MADHWDKRLEVAATRAAGYFVDVEEVPTSIYPYGISNESPSLQIKFTARLSCLQISCLNKIMYAHIVKDVAGSNRIYFDHRRTSLMESLWLTSNGEKPR